MAEVTYGQLSSWDDGNASDGNDFLKLEQGSNKMRIFTNPYQFIVHWFQDSSGANRKIKCAVENCPLCKKGIKTQYRWYLGVLDRKSGTAKLLEVSSQIYIGIKNYVNNPDWGDVKMYDIDIKRGAPNTNPLYTVMPNPNKRKLNSEEQSIVDSFLERVDISKFTQPPTPEDVVEKLGGSVPKAASKTDSGSKPHVNTDDFNFGDEEL